MASEKKIIEILKKYEIVLDLKEPIMALVF